MQLQYAILAHTVDGATHFDLLLEQPGVERLRTLQLERWPLKSGESCRCLELAPHRRVYLTYEGEISGGRGTVRRVESGTWRLADDEIALASAEGAQRRLKVEGETIFYG